MIMILNQNGEILKHWSLWEYIHGEIEKLCDDMKLEASKMETTDNGDLLVWVKKGA